MYKTLNPLIHRSGDKGTTGNSERGFTAIELMVVVGIVGILASIALPSYTDHTRKARRAAGGACALAMAQQMERFYTTALAYDADDSPTVFTCDADVNRFYRVDVDPDSVEARAFLLTALWKCG